jgi:hypothetical protein
MILTSAYQTMAGSNKIMYDINLHLLSCTINLSKL